MPELIVGHFGSNACAGIAGLYGFRQLSPVGHAARHDLGHASEVCGLALYKESRCLRCVVIASVRKGYYSKTGQAIKQSLRPPFGNAGLLRDAFRIVAIAFKCVKNTVLRS